MSSANQAQVLPTGVEYLYHVAPVDALEAIKAEGLRPDCSPDPEWEPVNRFVGRAAPIVGTAPYPVDRNQAVFFFEQPDIPTSWAADRDDHAVLAVSVDDFDGSMYCAEMGPITTLIDEYDSSPTAFDRALSQYQEGSIVEGSREAGIIRVLEYHLESLRELSVPEHSPLDAYCVELFTEAALPPDTIETIQR